MTGFRSCWTSCASQQIAMALLTNKPLEQSVKILDIVRAGAIFSVGGGWRRALAAQAGARRLAVPDERRHRPGPSETMLIGDSSVDLQTSRNAGVPICLARYGFGFADLAVDELRGDESLVDTPAEIAGVLHAGR